MNFRVKRAIAILAVAASAYAEDQTPTYSIPSQNNFHHDFGHHLPGDVLNLNVVPDPGVTNLTGHVDNGSSAGWVGGPSFTCVIPSDFSGLHLGKFSGTYNVPGEGGSGEPPVWNGASDEDVPVVESVVWLYNGVEIGTANDHPDAPIGLKWDPGADAPGGSIKDQFQLRAKVRTAKPPLSGIRVYFRPIDVDDPSTDEAPLDPNGTTGGDNREGFAWAPDSSTTDSQGYAYISIRVSKRPGDNERAGASTVASETAALSVANVRPDENLSHAALVHGKLSRMLTIWRSLHVETGSMEAKPNYNFPDDANVIIKSIDVDAAAGISTVRSHGAIRSPETCHYEGGRMVLGGVSYKVIDNTANEIFSDSIRLDGVVPAAVIAEVTDTIKEVNDDDARASCTPRFLNVDDEVKGYYKKAYISIANYGDQHAVTSFSTNTTSNLIYDPWAPWSVNYPSSASFWSVLLFSGYQPADDRDFDPDTEHDMRAMAYAAEGGTFGMASTLHPQCIVFLEMFNESPMVALSDLSRTIAHEIGHTGGGGHGDGGLMQDGALSLEGFSATTLSKLRSVETW